MILVHFFKTKPQSCNPCSFVENYPGSLGYTKAVRSEQMGGLYSVAFSKTVRPKGRGNSGDLEMLAEVESLERVVK